MFLVSSKCCLQRAQIACTGEEKSRKGLIIDIQSIKWTMEQCEGHYQQVKILWHHSDNINNRTSLHNWQKDKKQTCYWSLMELQKYRASTDHSLAQCVWQQASGLVECLCYGVGWLEGSSFSWNTNKQKNPLNPPEINQRPTCFKNRRTYYPTSITPMMKHGASCYWAASSAGTGAIVIREEIMDNTKYQTVLAQQLQASVRQLKMKKHFAL